jgi:hypothetical protein
MPTKTELIWDGKYHANGNRVAPLRVALPFQTVETVNETGAGTRAGDRLSIALFHACVDLSPHQTIGTAA